MDLLTKVFQVQHHLKLDFIFNKLAYNKFVTKTKIGKNDEFTRSHNNIWDQK